MLFSFEGRQASVVHAADPATLYKWFLQLFTRPSFINWLVSKAIKLAIKTILHMDTIHQLRAVIKLTCCYQTILHGYHPSAYILLSNFTAWISV